MINCLIIEDEIASQELLVSKINFHFPKLKIKGIIDNVSEAIQFLKNNKIDLVFLDNQIKEGRGLDIIKQFENPTFSVIYCTAFPEYAIDALNYNALYYLLKPYTTEEFKVAINKYFSKSNIKNNDYIILNHNSTKYKIPFDEIYYIKSEGSYTTFYLSTNKEIVTSKNIGSYIDKIPTNLFYRIHHSSIININMIKSFHLGSNPYVVLLNDVELTISKRKLKDFQNVILNSSLSI